jgi:hypothetical protein
MGGASKASQSDYAEAKIGLCEGAVICRIAPAIFQLEVMQKAKRTEPRRTGADALRARLTALPVHCPLLAAGLLRGPA